ncbi:iron-containing redox enzyme family protein [[Mycobacterium] kokjensenii]|uniref:Iron-containing redox enzyme family protein n=1 Tax=[Mycobacterium] kokjensenii TaxID=3064287 RepID=A0ABN9N7Z7_9MYCO|nr:iron-containing redox enzyme family protein [Mycolicibacter sp. MU0083]CAJ1501979.1 iron-containing redox enzyme family protein [Mycolicibacter sp. MU0083]
MSVPVTTIEPRLPLACGALSERVIEVLQGPAGSSGALGPVPAEPYGRDLQLTLYLCYELHYRGFSGVDPDWEWDATLLELRAQLEHAFLDGVRADVGPIPPDATVYDEMDSAATEPAHGNGITWYLRDRGSWEQVQEYFVHRSLYHLKEGDPHAWVIPRLTGQAKASFVAIEFDEYGAGRGQRLHQRLFADLLAAAGLDPRYLAYLDAVPAEALAVVNLMSLFGLHRRWRAAAIGHFAATEITSPPGSARVVAALRRLAAPEPCVAFYAEHVEADAVHEQVVRRDVVADLVDCYPDLERDVMFGMRAFDAVESRLANLLTTTWSAGQSTLLTL